MVEAENEGQKADSVWNVSFTSENIRSERPILVSGGYKVYELHILPQVLVQQRIGLVVRNPN